MATVYKTLEICNEEHNQRERKKAKLHFLLIETGKPLWAMFNSIEDQNNYYFGA